MRSRRESSRAAQAASFSLHALDRMPDRGISVADVQRTEGDVRLWLHPALANAGQLVVVVVVDAGGLAAILQQGDGRRALVIPVIGTATRALAADPIASRCSLSRERWRTTEPADAVNTYARSATLLLDL